MLVRREAGGDEVLQLPRGVDGGDDATVPTLRLALVRKMAALSREIRSRSASVSCLGWSGSLTDSNSAGATPGSDDLPGCGPTRQFM